MGIRGDRITAGVVKQWLMRLLLLSFVVRALIPLGYMPDASAAAKGVFKVVICSALGAKMVTLDEDGRPVPSHDDQQHESPCAFAGIAAVALPMPESFALIVPTLAIAEPLASMAVQLPPARAGPVLGSRGPPLFS